MSIVVFSLLGSIQNLVICIYCCITCKSLWVIFVIVQKAECCETMRSCVCMLMCCYCCGLCDNERTQ
eukprot:UN00303